MGALSQTRRRPSAPACTEASCSTAQWCWWRRRRRHARAPKAAATMAYQVRWFVCLSICLSLEKLITDDERALTRQTDPDQSGNPVLHFPPSLPIIVNMHMNLETIVHDIYYILYWKIAGDFSRCIPNNTMYPALIRCAVRILFQFLDFAAIQGKGKRWKKWQHPFRLRRATSEQHISCFYYYNQYYLLFERAYSECAG